MYQSVLAAFPTFSTKFEGRVPWMYVDVKNLVTTGMGNLIDPMPTALQLPWKHGQGGPLASPEEIKAAWTKVKNSGYSQLGGGNAKFQQLSDLRLDNADIDALIAGKMSNNETILRRNFPGYDTWPADAQLGLHSMAWAMGPNFNYPNFKKAVSQLVPDFDTAAVQSYMTDNPQKSMDYPPTTNPGLRPRNKANYQLFKNAAFAIQNGNALDALIWNPGQILGAVASAASSAVDTAVDVQTTATQVAKRNPWFTFFGVTSMLGVTGLGAWYASKLAKKEGLK